MCDTAIITPEASPTGQMIFLKNSDRDANEAQQVVSEPARHYEEGEKLKCTYIEIPQVRKTHAIMLSKPYWLWGAEMGFNEHGVGIGNEAVFTKVGYEKNPGLIGMDLLRLGLERGATARESLEVITSLLKKYGQGGNCKPGKKFSYHNSFIIADPNEAYVLETMGRDWVAKKIKGVYAISNGLTIQSDYDESSETLNSMAKARGWCGESGKPQALADQASDFLYTALSGCKTRRHRLETILRERSASSHDVESLMLGVFAALRDHGHEEKHPQQGLVGDTVCLHAAFGPTRYAQTTGSLAVWLRPHQSLGFVTGTAAPCTSFFKPIWVDTVPDHGRLRGGASFDPQTLFWKHELLHREALKNFKERTDLISELQRELETKWMAEAVALADESQSDRIELSARAFEQADRSEEKLLDQFVAQDGGFKSGLLFRLEWSRLNKKAGLTASN